MAREFTPELIREQVKSTADYIGVSWQILGGRQKMFRARVDSGSSAHIRLSLCVNADVFYPIVGWELSRGCMEPMEKEEYIMGTFDPLQSLTTISGMNLLVDRLRVYNMTDGEALSLVYRALNGLYQEAHREFSECAERFAPHKSVRVWNVLDYMFRQQRLLVAERDEAITTLSAIRIDCLASWKVVGRNKFIGRMRQRVEETLTKLGVS